MCNPHHLLIKQIYSNTAENTRITNQETIFLQFNIKVLSALCIPSLLHLLNQKILLPSPPLPSPPLEEKYLEDEHEEQRHGADAGHQQSGARGGVLHDDGAEAAREEQPAAGRGAQ